MTPFVEELSAFKAERLMPLAEAGKLSLASVAPQGDVRPLLRVAMANEISVSELAAVFMPSTPEVDVKLAFARQAGDEAGHYQLVSGRLAALGVDSAPAVAPAANPLFDYVRTLETTVERVAAALFTLESLAYAVNENFMAFCERAGDAETVRLYREIIQPEERAHQRLGGELLGKYAVTADDQTRARTVVAKVLELANATRTQAAKRLGVACFPGC